MKKNFIPTIDISPLLNGLNSKKSKETIKKIEKACVEIGFFQIVNHGMNKKQIQSISNVGNKFFRSSEQNKINYKLEFYFGDDNLILIEVGNFKYKALMNAWLNHLYLTANSGFNSKTLIISRQSNYNKKSNFEVTKQILPISKQEAIKTLRHLNLIATSGSLSFACFGYL